MQLPVATKVTVFVKGSPPCSCTSRGPSPLHHNSKAVSHCSTAPYLLLNRSNSVLKTTHALLILFSLVASLPSCEAVIRSRLVAIVSLGFDPVLGAAC